MKRHIRALETQIQYDPNDGAEVCESRTVMYYSTIRFACFEYIRKTFKILSHFGLVFVIVENRSHMQGASQSAKNN